METIRIHHAPPDKSFVPTMTFIHIRTKEELRLAQKWQSQKSPRPAAWVFVPIVEGEQKPNETDSSHT